MLAATRALAELAREEVPEAVLTAYAGETIRFGLKHLIPKPFDHSVLYYVAPAVAQAAMETGVARVQLDLDEYRERLRVSLGPGREVMRWMTVRARRRPARLVIPEGHNDTVIRAAASIEEEGVARPILVGRPSTVREKARSMGVDLIQRGRGVRGGRGRDQGAVRVRLLPAPRAQGPHPERGPPGDAQAPHVRAPDGALRGRRRRAGRHRFQLSGGHPACPNAAYKLLDRLGGPGVIGPIVLGCPSHPHPAAGEHRAGPAQPGDHRVGRRAGQNPPRLSGRFRAQRDGDGPIVSGDGSMS